jgi:hypothetical protein
MKEGESVLEINGEKVAGDDFLGTTGPDTRSHSGATKQNTCYTSIGMRCDQRHLSFFSHQGSEEAHFNILPRPWKSNNSQQSKHTSTLLCVCGR